MGGCQGAVVYHVARPGDKQLTLVFGQPKQSCHFCVRGIFSLFPRGENRSKSNEGRLKRGRHCEWAVLEVVASMGDHNEETTKQEAKLQAGAPSFTDDFICISEFSEIVGPVPLFCIPESGKGAFNIEKFVIRIMAVDYQNKNCDPGAFVDDTQVVITEPTENAFAYVRECLAFAQRSSSADAWMCHFSFSIIPPSFFITRYITSPYSMSLRGAT
jgi:hypothetical protein